MESLPLYLGIDGGGTKCKARLESAEGELLGEGLSGSANPVQGVQRACDAIVDSAKQAIEAAGLAPDVISNINAGLGLAGVTLPSFKQKMIDWEHPFAKVIVTSDLHIACVGAHDGKDGAVIISGTGFNAGANLHGEYVEFGGYGFVLADKGSGAKLGAEALRVSLEYLDGIAEYSPLIQAVFDKIGCSEALSIVEKSIHWTPAAYAEFAPLVLKLAHEDDIHAINLVKTAADHINRIARRLLVDKPPRLSMIGGVSEPIQHWLDKDIQKLILPPLKSPEVGAILLVRQKLGGIQ